MLQHLSRFAYLEAVLNCLVPVVDVVLLLKLAQGDLLCVVFQRAIRCIITTLPLKTCPHTFSWPASTEYGATPVARASLPHRSQFCKHFAATGKPGERQGAEDALG
jgi:hypothetical protein